MTMWLERLAKPSPTNEAPTPGELRRNDLLVLALVLFVLLLAFGIRNQVLNASTKVRLGENLPRVAYPERWRTQTTEDVLLHVINAGSPSTFDTQMVITGRPLRSDESLEDARADRSIKLAASLPGYRELEAGRMVVLDNQPALVTTYAFIADPTRDAGASGLPVVVEAQDIMFLGGGEFLVMTLAADANAWDEEQRSFAIITDSLRLQPLPEDAAVDVEQLPDAVDGPAAPAAPTPAAPGQDSPDTGSSTAEPGAFGSGAQSQGGVVPGESEAGTATEMPAGEPDNGDGNGAQSEGGN